MTVTSTEFFTDWLVADGTNKNWGYDFTLVSEDHIIVEVRQGLDGEIIRFNSNFLWTPLTTMTGVVVYPVDGAALASGYFVRLVRNVPHTQEVEIGNEGPFHPELHEEAFDGLTMQAQQLADAVNRAVKVPLGSDVDTSVLQEYLEQVGSNILNVITVGDNINDVNQVAAIIAEVVIVANNILAVQTTAGNITSVNTVAGNITAVNTVAGISVDVATLAAIAAAITTVADISVEVAAVGAITAAVSTVAGISADVETTAAIAAQIVTVAGINANVTTVAGIATNVTAVASNAVNINAVNANSSNINTVAANAANINTVATDIADVQTAAANMAAIQAAPGAASDAEDARDFAYLWANEAEDVAVNDGVHTGYSTWHWYQKVLAIASSIGAAVAGAFHAAAGKATPVDNDELGLVDSADGWALKKLTWANLKATLGSTFLPLDGSAAMTGPLVLPASTTSATSLHIPPGVDPTAPANGDVWLDSGGLRLRRSGTTAFLWDSSSLALISKADAEAGTSTTSRIWSAERVAQAIAALTPPPPPGLGVGQTWQNVTASRAKGTAYQNTTGGPIWVSVLSNSTTGDNSLYISDDNVNWSTLDLMINISNHAPRVAGIIPNGKYYKATGQGTLAYWWELRS